MSAGAEPQSPNPLLNPEAVIEAYELTHIDPLGTHSTAREIGLVSIGLEALTNELLKLRSDDPEEVADIGTAAVSSYTRLIRGILGFNPDDDTYEHLDEEGVQFGKDFLEMHLPSVKRK